jgi:glycosyltransferase involved in cell wall biosynthesis
VNATRPSIEASARSAEATAGGDDGRPRPLGRSRPELVSVLIPVRNGEAFIAEQLAALGRQTYPGRWELVVIDNGCTDRSLEIVERYRSQLPEVVIVNAADRTGLNYARGRGVSAARGDLLAFCDSDDVVSPGWLGAMVSASADADLIAGLLDGTELNNALTRGWRPAHPSGALTVKHDFLPHAPGGNCAVWRDVLEHVAWDNSFAFGSSDIEFSWRVQLAGYRLGLAPDAVVHMRFRPALGAMLRQSYAYGKSDAQLYRRFRHEGMGRRTRREAMRSWSRLLSTVPDLRSEPARGLWLRLAARHSGRVVGSLRWRVRFL